MLNTFAVLFIPPIVLVTLQHFGGCNFMMADCWSSAFLPHSFGSYYYSIIMSKGRTMITMYDLIVVGIIVCSGHHLGLMVDLQYDSIYVLLWWTQVGSLVWGCEKKDLQKETLRLAELELMEINLIDIMNIPPIWMWLNQRKHFDSSWYCNEAVIPRDPR